SVDDSLGEMLVGQPAKQREMNRGLAVNVGGALWLIAGFPDQVQQFRRRGPSTLTHLVGLGCGEESQLIMEGRGYTNQPAKQRNSTEQSKQGVFAVVVHPELEDPVGSAAVIACWLARWAHLELARWSGYARMAGRAVTC
ncbi:hypothetical protein NL676_039264, partial [Syzygium grande]